jgi:hypothetical protein
MYTPKFNSVLVQIDDADAAWGTGNEEAMLGKSYSKGKFIDIQEVFITNDYPMQPESLEPFLIQLKGKEIMWNEGAEAGTTFEEDGKLYGFIYWYDIRGVKE